MSPTPRRLAAENVTLRLRPTAEATTTHDIDVSISYDIGDRRVVEIAFVTRGKIGGGLDTMLQDMGIQLSRALQGRSIDSGEPVATSALNLSHLTYAAAVPEAVEHAATLCHAFTGLKTSEALQELIAASKRAVDAMTPEQRDEMWKAQRESFGRSYWDEGTRAVKL